MLYKMTSLRYKLGKNNLWAKRMVARINSGGWRVSSHRKRAAPRHCRGVNLRQLDILSSVMAPGTAVTG